MVFLQTPHTSCHQTELSEKQLDYFTPPHTHTHSILWLLIFLPRSTRLHTLFLLFLPTYWQLLSCNPTFTSLQNSIYAHPLSFSTLVHIFSLSLWSTWPSSLNLIFRMSLLEASDSPLAPPVNYCLFCATFFLIHLSVNYHIAPYLSAWISLPLDLRRHGDKNTWLSMSVSPEPSMLLHWTVKLIRTT